MARIPRGQLLRAREVARPVGDRPARGTLRWPVRLSSPAPLDPVQIAVDPVDRLAVHGETSRAVHHDPLGPGSVTGPRARHVPRERPTLDIEPAGGSRARVGVRSRCAYPGPGCRRAAPRRSPVRQPDARQPTIAHRHRGISRPRPIRTGSADQSRVQFEPPVGGVDNAVLVPVRGRAAELAAAPLRLAAAGQALRPSGSWAVRSAAALSDPCRAARSAPARAAARPERGGGPTRGSAHRTRTRTWSWLAPARLNGLELDPDWVC